MNAVAGQVLLNVGSCDEVIPGFISVDIQKPADVIADLKGQWPWKDNSVDGIRAHDIFEHLPNKAHTMNEAWRVLKPGGILDLVVPSVAGYGAFQDPEHCSWWTPYDLWYYCAEREQSKWRVYGERVRFGVDPGPVKNLILPPNLKYREKGISALFGVRKWTHENYVRNDPHAWKVFALLEALKPEI